MSLASRFAHAARSNAQEVDDDPALEAALREAFARGAESWPNLALAPEVFATYIGERTPRDVAAIAWLGEARATDLFLACAAAEDVPGAHAAFEATYVPQFAGYLRPLRASPELVRETTQGVLVKLFVGTAGGPPRIRQYTGEGALGAWVKVVTVRTAVDLLAVQKSNEQPTEDLDAIADAVTQAGDAERQLVESRYQAPFKDALRGAMKELSLRDRALLRLAFIEQLTPGRIGVMYGVHRTTVMRWLDAAKADVLERTRARLIDTLGVSPSECESLIAALHSRIDITLSSLLDHGG